jgi:hypothetical protein
MGGILTVDVGLTLILLSANRQEQVYIRPATHVFRIRRVLSESSTKLVCLSQADVFATDSPDVMNGHNHDPKGYARKIFCGDELTQHFSS